MIRLLLCALCLAAGMASAAPECRLVTHKSQDFTVCDMDVATQDLRLFLRDAQGEIHGSFRSVDRTLSETGMRLAFAMNAGMYHADRRPVGLYIENSAQEQRLITAPGPGNFGLVPNGVFCLRAGRADVFETLEFEAAAPECIHATQSGPMLVINGDLHPRFLPNGTSRYVRNGVGTSADGQRAVFAISEAPVTFHEFGTLFRDVLQLPNALYFDGNISRLHAPELQRSDLGVFLGPIVGVVVPQD